MTLETMMMTLREKRTAPYASGRERMYVFEWIDGAISVFPWSEDGEAGDARIAQ